MSDSDSKQDPGSAGAAPTGPDLTPAPDAVAAAPEAPPTVGAPEVDPGPELRAEAAPEAGDVPPDAPQPPIGPDPAGEPVIPPIPAAGETAGEPSAGPSKQVRIGAAVAIVAALLLGAWAVFGGKGAGTTASPSPSASPSAAATKPNILGPVIADEAAVKAAVAKSGHPVFWAGNRKGTTMELTITGDNVVEIRYLPAGATPGAGTYLTVASWPDEQAWEQLQQAAERDGGMSVEGKGKAKTMYTTNSDTPNNAYAAIEGVPVLGEAFDPEPGSAWELIRTGKIVLVEP